MGCVLAELLLGQPLFPGESGVDQLVEIIKVLGTPTREQIQAMNEHYTEFKFPQIKAHPWNRVFRSRTPPEAIDLVSRILQYDPNARVTPLEACAHPFFDELRDPNTVLPSGRKLPVSRLFNFTSAGKTCLLALFISHLPATVEMSGYSHLYSKLVPEWARGGVHDDAEVAYQETEGAREAEGGAAGDSAPTTADPSKLLP